MKKSNELCWRLAPANGYDIPALECWLEKMSSQGLVFSMTAGPFTCFHATGPDPLRIHLEPARTKTDQEDQELTALYEAAGWKYLGIFRKNYFVYASQDENAQAHTDSEVLDYALRRFFRQKLLGGIGLLLVNILLLNFFSLSTLGVHHLRYFWAEALAGDLIPWALTRFGLFLVDLAYLHGLWVLWRFRKQIQKGLSPTPAPGTRFSGAAIALASVALALVAVEFSFLYFTHGYFPYDLAGSNFVTLTEIEGEDFPLSGDYMYNMDYISHEDTPLTPESWYFQQYGNFSQHDSTLSLNDVPHLEIQITRYLLPLTAERRVWEWRSWGGHDSYRMLEPANGLDEVWLSQSGRREGFCYLVLRQDSTVMRVEYLGSQDITRFLPRFSETMEVL